MLKTTSIMTRKPSVVSPDCPIDLALRRLRERKLRHLLVVDRERLVGILSERDLMEPSAPSPDAVTVRDRMSVPVETLTGDESVQLACRRLIDRRIGCLPVVQRGRVSGVVSESDFLKLYLRACEFGGHEPGFDPPVVEVMSPDVVSVPPEESVASAWKVCTSRRIRHLPVVHDGWLVGMASDRDLLDLVGGVEAETRKVGDRMTKEFISVPAGATLSGAARIMLENRLHSLPVLVGGAMKGIVTSTDVLAMLCAVDEAALASAWTEEQALSAERAEE